MMCGNVGGRDKNGYNAIFFEKLELCEVMGNWK